MIGALKGADDPATIKRIRGEVSALCKSFPVPAAALKD